VNVVEKPPDPPKRSSGWPFPSLVGGHGSGSIERLRMKRADAENPKNRYGARDDGPPPGARPRTAFQAASAGSSWNADMVFPSRRTAVLVHGCHWHQHEGCRLARQQKSRLDYWLPKLARNKVRDRTAQKDLRALGWQVLVIWECKTKDPEIVRSKLASFFSPPDQTGRAGSSRVRAPPLKPRRR
jgi:DNA mismatch endonuclease Vsr